MTPHNQRICIAEYLGWHGFEETAAMGLLAMLGPLRGFLPVPDYPNDLNAMFDALRQFSWQVFTCDNGYRVQIFTAPEKGSETLADVAGYDLRRVLVESFIRAIGKWVDA